jgi:GNAT superfamily N-acetyltransferase
MNPGRLPTGVTVRPLDVADEAGLAAYVRIRNAVTPDDTDSLEQVRWAEATYPGEVVRFLAEAGGEAVGAASTGRIWVHAPGYARYWLGTWVEPQSRGRGIGSHLYAASSEAARAAGRTGFETQLSEAYPEGHRFLANRGFVVTDRSKMVRLDLADLEAPAIGAPSGIVLTTLAERPDLVAGVHAVALEAFPDIPSADEPIEVGSLEAFVARDVDRVGIPKDGFVVALDAATGAVVGYASLIYAAGSTTVAYHDMTAVRRPSRGRGIAVALKRATIAWAVAHHLEALDTGNDEANLPMRAVNAALGYQPVPDWLGLQGPLAPSA